MLDPWWLPLAAWALDQVVGDPPRPTHPVVLMGRLIGWLEARLNQGAQRRLTGSLLVVLVVSLSYAASRGAIRLAALAHPLLGLVVNLWLLQTALAVRSLADHAAAVSRPLESGDLDGARQRLGWIVGRDTAELPEPEVVRGTLEAVAESTCDGVIAPLFWAAIGGAPLALAYKAVNTLDSMIGHKNERYLAFGWAAARLDDLANWLPARLSGLLLALVTGKPKQALTTIQRDAKEHPSPNAGWPEAAVAGALGVRLGGLNYYQGIASFRAYLGEPKRPLTADLIPTTVAYMQRAALITVLLISLARWFYVAGV